MRKPSGDQPGPKGPTDHHVLRIKTNLDGVEFEVARPTREVVGANEFWRRRQLSSTMSKLHQLEGFRWMTEAWKAGWPGVLLADDMGLGKTFQALAFLAWLRANQLEAKRRSGISTKKPVLIVAPTALLKNWIAKRNCTSRPTHWGTCGRIRARITAAKATKNRRLDPGRLLDVCRSRRRLDFDDLRNSRR